MLVRVLGFSGLGFGSYQIVVHRCPGIMHVSATTGWVRGEASRQQHLVGFARHWP